jgi:hypothetical protein
MSDEIDRETPCANCGHPKRIHSGLAGCYQCDGDEFCEHFVLPETTEQVEATS